MLARGVNEFREIVTKFGEGHSLLKAPTESDNNGGAKLQMPSLLDDTTRKCERKENLTVTSLMLSLLSIVLISSLFRIFTKVAILLAHLVALTVKLSTFS